MGLGLLLAVVLGVYGVLDVVFLGLDDLVGTVVLDWELDGVLLVDGPGRGLIGWLGPTTCFVWLVLSLLAILR